MKICLILQNFRATHVARHGKRGFVYHLFGLFLYQRKHVGAQILVPAHRRHDVFLCWSDSWLSKQSYAWTIEYFLDLYHPSLISVYNMILVKTSIEAMPSELEESAYLDGAGYIRRLVSIVCHYKNLLSLRLPYL